jgi:alpha-beta hydrolase superfamily lysophospholipase
MFRFCGKNYLSENFEIEKINFDNVEIELNIHRSDTHKILINYPGADGSIDGYNYKYRKIANWLSGNGIANVIRLDNKYCIDKLPYVEMIIAKLAFVIEQILNYPIKYSGRDKIELYLAGVSAGAGAVATLLSEFPEIKKALLIAPHDSVGLENILRGVKNYTGEIFLLAGENDEIGTHEKANLLFEQSAKARKQISLIPKCDHQFTGHKNGKIFSSAFLWAFSDPSKLPGRRNGIMLYK